jgi:hypothetical protein
MQNQMPQIGEYPPIPESQGVKLNIEKAPEQFQSMLELAEEIEGEIEDVEAVDKINLYMKAKEIYEQVYEKLQLESEGLGAKEKFAEQDEINAFSFIISEKISDLDSHLRYLQQE